MIRSIFLAAALAVAAIHCAQAAPAASVAPAAHPANKYKVNLPPSADLSYAIKAKQSGLQIDGNAKIEWRASAGQYSIAAETSAMLVGKILDARSEGAIDDYGLAPAKFTEKRFRKDPTNATFNRQSKTISFSDSPQTYPLLGGEQDRNSAVWQLAAVARGAQGKFKPGSAWTFFVAGQKDAEAWTFKVIRQEKVNGPTGSLSALHILRMPPPNSKGQQLDIWLAPSLEWYPVRLRFTDADGEYIEQTLDSINKK